MVLQNAELGEIKNQLDHLEEKVDQILQLLLAKKSLSYQLPFQLQVSAYSNVHCCRRLISSICP